METAQQTADRVALVLKTVSIRRRQKPEPRRELDARFEFAVRSESDADVVGIDLRCAPTIPFGDVGRN
jgi:hypothetical protein